MFDVMRMVFMAEMAIQLGLKDGKWDFSMETGEEGGDRRCCKSQKWHEFQSVMPRKQETFSGSTDQCIWGKAQDRHRDQRRI